MGRTKARTTKEVRSRKRKAGPDHCLLAMASLDKWREIGEPLHLVANWADFFTVELLARVVKREDGVFFFRPDHKPKEPYGDRPLIWLSLLNCNVSVVEIQGCAVVMLRQGQWIFLIYSGEKRLIVDRLPLSTSLVQ